MVKCVFSFQHDTMNTTLCYFEDVNIICTSARELFAAFFYALDILLSISLSFEQISFGQ